MFCQKIWSLAWDCYLPFHKISHRPWYYFNARLRPLVWVNFENTLQNYDCYEYLAKIMYSRSTFLILQDMLVTRPTFWFNFSECSCIFYTYFHNCWGFCLASEEDCNVKARVVPTKPKIFRSFRILTDFGVSLIGEFVGE